MSHSFVRAARIRAVDGLRPALPPSYVPHATVLPLPVYRLLVDNCDPSSVGADEILCALAYDNTKHDWASRLRDSGVPQVINVPGTLDRDQCALLRQAVDGATMSAMDSVDGLLEFQLSLDTQGFKAFLGKEGLGEQTLERLTALAHQCHHELCKPLSAEADEAARASGVQATTPALPELPHEVFIRRFSDGTRPWFNFHFDDAQLTVNIALSDDDDHEGGRLLAVVDGRVQQCKRSAGTATVHASTLLHGVTRMTSGERYSLILFYRPICPRACHPLVPCDVATMAMIYPRSGGSYSCDSCGSPADDLGDGPMWRCVEGCEYDVCDACHRVGLADGVEYVTVSGRRR